MHLSCFYKKLLVITALVLTASGAFAYDYPVVGEYNAYYENVFKAMKDGRCESMDTELKALSDNEGVSPNIYTAICYFEKKNNDKGFRSMDAMLSNQEYDEALYVVQSEMDKGNTDPRLVKYRGLAYFNIGALNSALTDLSAYLEKAQDDEARYALTDIYITLKNFDAASGALEGVAVKDGGYRYRKGRIALRTGKMNTALRELRMVTPADKKSYPSAKMLLGEICASSKRYNCAEKEYAAAAESEDYKDIATEKSAKLNDAKKLFSGFLSVGGQHDSNVTSIDEDEVPGASKVKSFRVYGVADVKFNFYPSFAESISIGMMNYATSNENLHDYDMSTHKIYVSMKKLYDSFEIVLPKISTSVTYFGGEKYSTAVSGEASIKYMMDTWTFGVPLKVTRSNYMNDEATPTLSKDGYKYEGALEVSKTFAEIYTAKVKGGLAHDDVAGEEKVKNDMIFNTSLSAKLFKRFTPTLGFSYANYDYSNNSREDDYFSYSLKGVYVLTSNIFLGGGVTYTKTDSNENAYDYNKTVTELSVSYSF